MQSRELMQMNYTAAAETLVRSWNDVVVEVLDRYQHLIDRQQNNSSLKFEIMAKQLYVASQRVL